MTQRENSSDRWRLRIVKVSVVFVLIALLIVGNRRSAYPIVNWPMYSRTPMPFPADTKSHYEIRVVTPRGGQFRLDEHSFFPYGRETVARTMLGAAFSSPEPDVRERFRASLAAMIERRLRERFVRAEVWEQTWHVEPLASPPLARSAPASEVLIGVIEPTGPRP